MLPIEIIRKQKMVNALFTHGTAGMDSLASDLLDAPRQGVCAVNCTNMISCSTIASEFRRGI